LCNQGPKRKKRAKNRTFPTEQPQGRLIVIS
jgi:hypothetical protein